MRKKAWGESYVVLGGTRMPLTGRTVRMEPGKLVFTVTAEIALPKGLQMEPRRRKKGPRGKVTPDQVRQMRREFVGWKARFPRKKTEFYRQQAKKYGMSVANVGFIVNRNTWKEI